jgi:hypothetical protein
MPARNLLNEGGGRAIPPSTKARRQDAERRGRERGGGGLVRVCVWAAERLISRIASLFPGVCFRTIWLPVAACSRLGQRLLLSRPAASQSTTGFGLSHAS